MKRYITEVAGVPSFNLPYSYGVMGQGQFLFVSGQGPWDPEKNAMICGSLKEQTELTLACIERIVKAAGGKREDIVSCRVFLNERSEENFAQMNAAYAAFFGDTKPARTTVGASLRNIGVEIDAIALIE